ncbi:nuclease-related domain-containing protein [Metabacillus sediminilitoris]|uniref:NERD domain-containing protein n=2 Tax=Metabacillus sediminilitoris TaxID=2567941 RepID=A0A4V3WFS7_9BACI|nr:nuclease-related domain-containing protein [Metabacillus sediminilitoris]QGQ48182.1 NERD domain-containing protein [Metabacillus sediminilitoris]THF81457.1 NERD domain-containing protein [Metabacillus sediminilitoris]
MIMKQRLYPEMIKKLEMLQLRIPTDHQKYHVISGDLAKRRAGYFGERSIDYYLEFLPDKHFILHDVRLFDGAHYFQLDTVILSRKFILILEVKNYAGTLFFDSNFNQLIRIQDEKKEAFPDPILQVERQSYQLKKWLRLAHYDMPVESLVIISTPRTILGTTPQNEKIYRKVIQSAKLPFVMMKLEQTNKKNYISEEQLLQLSKFILDSHSPLEIDILTHYQIQKSDIIKGVICSQCQAIPMERRKGKWICETCSFVSKDAHISALKDYSLLIDTTITNKKMRDFLKISSTSVANKLLFSLKLRSSGTNKGESTS